MGRELDGMSLGFFLSFEQSVGKGNGDGVGIYSIWMDGWYV